MGNASKIYLAAAAVLLFQPVISRATDVPSEWQYSQTVQSPEKGWVRAKLPKETVGAGTPFLTDLRLFDTEGKEVSFRIDRPRPDMPYRAPLAEFRVQLQKGETVVTGTIPSIRGTKIPSEVELITPAVSFLKPIRVETSQDGLHWAAVLKDYPIYRELGVWSEVRIPISRVTSSFLRITLDDSSTPAIPIQMANVWFAGTPGEFEKVSPLILEDSSDANKTDIVLALPAKNLTIESFEIQTDEPAFSRQVQLVTRRLINGRIRETVLTSCFIHRVTLGHTTREELTVPFHQQIPSDQLILKIFNNDNPPLKVSRVVLQLLPAYLVYYAQAPRTDILWAGNPNAETKSYDVSALRGEMRGARYGSAVFGPLTRNPTYQQPEVLPGVNEAGSPIDVSAWHFRKKVAIQDAGVQRLKLDMESIAHDEIRLSDLRLVRQGNQIPYILDAMSIEGSLDLRSELQATVKDQPHISRWILPLPEHPLPIAYLRCSTKDSLFQRTADLYEEIPDERGEKQRRFLGRTMWTRTFGQTSGDFTMNLAADPQSDHLILEMDNGDNPPVHLDQFRAFYRVPQLLFKASSGSDLFLYYGEPTTAAPSYDLNLAAAELMTAQPTEATLGPEEVLMASPWWQLPAPGGSLRYIFWAVMGLVVIVLLVVIAKLLPEDSKPG